MNLRRSAVGFFGTLSILSFSAAILWGVATFLSAFLSLPVFHPLWMLGALVGAFVFGAIADHFDGDARGDAS